MIIKKIARKLIQYTVKKSIMKSHLKKSSIKKISRLLSSGREIKLEIGNPVKGKNGWITLDISIHADIYWDLLTPLPFPDDSVSIIYSSHVLEHFYYRDLMRLLKECFRIIKPGGLFNVCVPNAGPYINAYSNPVSFDMSFLTYQPAIISKRAIDIVNYIAYMDGEHRYMFDQDNLLHVLSEAGFVDVCSREFDFEFDMRERKHESIYAICSKPFQSL